MAPASDCRPANDGRLLAPPIDTLAKLAREAIALGTTSQAAELAFEFERGVGELKADFYFSPPFSLGRHDPPLAVCRLPAGPRAQLKTAYFSSPQPPAQQRRGQVWHVPFFRLRGRLRAAHVHVICMYPFFKTPLGRMEWRGDKRRLDSGSTRDNECGSRAPLSSVRHGEDDSAALRARWRLQQPTRRRQFEVGASYCGGS